MWHHPVSKVEQTSSKMNHSSKTHPYGSNSLSAKPYSDNSLSKPQSHNTSNIAASSSGGNSPRHLHQSQQHTVNKGKSHTLPKPSQHSKVKLSPSDVNGALSGPVSPTSVGSKKPVKLSPRERGNVSSDKKKKVAETAT